MIRSSLASLFWRASIFLCLALVASGFMSTTGISPAAVVVQNIYTVQRGTPVAIPNFVDLDAGCNWSGIGGQIFDQTGAPATGVRVRISGTFDGRQILQTLTSGSSQRFGQGGFDLKLGDRPLASQTIRLQLFDAAGSRLSSPFVVKTYGTCQQNLLVMNLTPTAVSGMVFLPKVSR
jgi:hypothetical protein